MWFSARFRLEAVAKLNELKLFPLRIRPIKTGPSQSAGPSSTWLFINRATVHNFPWFLHGAYRVRFSGSVVAEHCMRRVDGSWYSCRLSGASGIASVQLPRQCHVVESQWISFRPRAQEKISGRPRDLRGRVDLVGGCKREGRSTERATSTTPWGWSKTVFQRIGNTCALRRSLL